LQARRASATSRLPLQIPLEEVSALNTSIKQFALDRLKPHCPPITEVAFEDVLRLDGATIICDGFDRLDARVRAGITAQLNNLHRDYSMLQLFVFSRPNAAPRLD